MPYYSTLVITRIDRHGGTSCTCCDGQGSEQHSEPAESDADHMTPVAAVYMPEAL